MPAAQGVQADRAGLAADREADLAVAVLAAGQAAPVDREGLEVVPVARVLREIRGDREVLEVKGVLVLARVVPVVADQVGRVDLELRRVRRHSHLRCPWLR